MISYWSPRKCCWIGISYGGHNEEVNTLKMWYTKWFCITRWWRTSKTWLRWTMQGWRASKRLDAEGPRQWWRASKGLDRWTMKCYMKLWVIHINHMKNARRWKAYVDRYHVYWWDKVGTVYMLMNIKSLEEIMVMNNMHMGIMEDPMNLLKAKVWNVGHFILPVSVISGEKTGLIR